MTDTKPAEEPMNRRILSISEFEGSIGGYAAGYYFKAMINTEKDRELTDENIFKFAELIGGYSADYYYKAMITEAVEEASSGDFVKSIGENIADFVKSINGDAKDYIGAIAAIEENKDVNVTIRKFAESIGNSVAKSYFKRMGK